MKSILILFDIDGTILKVKDGLSKKIFQKVISNFFNLTEISVDIDFDFSGLTDLDIIQRISKIYKVDFDLVLRNIESIWNELDREFKSECKREDIFVYDCVEELIQNLHKNEKVALGLLTGNFKFCAYYKLQLIGFEKFFPIGAFGDESINRSDLHKKAIERANLFYKTQKFSNHNTFVIGDSIYDVISAKENKIKVVAVATGRTPLDELSKHNPDLLLRDFCESEKLIKFLGL